MASVLDLLYKPIFNAQVWISPRPTKRSVTHDKTTIAGPAKQFTATFLHDYPRDDGKGSYDFSMRLKKQPKHPYNQPGHPNSAPPNHIHPRQDEYFNVIQGGIVVTLEGAVVERDSSHGTVVVPKKAKHTFRPNEKSEGTIDLVISTLGPGADEQFFRNLYSYQSDCDSLGLTPSLFQLLLFFDAGDVFLADPPGIIAWLLNKVGGVLIGGWILGYRRSYPEYFQGSKTTTYAQS